MTTNFAYQYKTINHDRTTTKCKTRSFCQKYIHNGLQSNIISILWDKLSHLIIYHPLRHVFLDLLDIMNTYEQ